MHIEALHLGAVMIFLVAAGIAVPLVRRLGISPILGYLVVGLIIGPFGLGRFVADVPWLAHVTITDHDGVKALAELGVVFLLFMIGLELSLERLWSMRRLVFGLGTAQVVVTGLIISTIALAFDNSIAAAIVLGAAFALSSTAIVVEELSQKRRLGSSAGRVSFAILLFQDLAVLPILFLVSAFGAAGGVHPGLAFLSAMAQAAVAIAAILIAGRIIIKPLFRFVGFTANREMFLALVLLIIIGTAVATSRVGLSMALGAFLAGLLFAETEYRHEIEADIEPFKGLLLGLFFVSVGMSIDPVQMAARPHWLLASVIGLFAIKGVITYLLVRIFGETRAVAVESALLLGQAGEFALLIVGMALSLGLMPHDTVQFMLLVTSLTMLATPVVARVARNFGQRMEAHEAQTVHSAFHVPHDIRGHVVIIGYGRVGQLLGSMLAEQGIAHIAIDTDATTIAPFVDSGAPVYHGDGGRPELLERLGIARAAALVVTMDSPHRAERVVEAAHTSWPHLQIYARARDVAHSGRLVALGAHHVVPETLEASLQLVERVLSDLGIPDPTARHVIELRRQAEQAVVDAG